MLNPKRLPFSPLPPIAPRDALGRITDFADYHGTDGVLARDLRELIEHDRQLALTVKEALTILAAILVTQEDTEITIPPLVLLHLPPNGEIRRVDHGDGSMTYKLVIRD